MAFAKKKEFASLINYLGGHWHAGAKLKSTKQWIYPNPEFTEIDEYGFSALPAGSHSLHNTFDHLGLTCLWWCSTEYDSLDAWYYETGCYGHLQWGDYPKLNAFSVRCLKD
jgi:uncharacterized protein (TIGR02145 family)